MGGHSDVVMEQLSVKMKIAEQLYFLQNSCGAVPGPRIHFWF